MYQTRQEIFFYAVSFCGSLLCGGVCDLYSALSPTCVVMPIKLRGPLRCSFAHYNYWAWTNQRPTKIILELYI